MTLHHVALRYITLHCVTLRYITLHIPKVINTTLHQQYCCITYYIKIHFIKLHDYIIIYTSHNITSHCITLHHMYITSTHRMYFAHGTDTLLLSMERCRQRCKPGGVYHWWRSGCPREPQSLLSRWLILHLSLTCTILTCFDSGLPTRSCSSWDRVLNINVLMQMHVSARRLVSRHSFWGE